jgi:AcrR family transcriptional regulator
MKASSGLDTKTQILDIAETHFALYGFAGTSLRGIIKDANVNVAAVAYHFGAKEDLFEAVVDRFAGGVVQAQLDRLRKEMTRPRVNIKDVVRSFYEPPLTLVSGLGSKGETLSLFLGRAQTEPEPVYSMVDKHFAACRDEFIAAFKRVLPGLSTADYQWRFEFMLALIVAFLTRQKPIRARYGDKGAWHAEPVVSRLVDFCAAGMRG